MATTQRDTTVLTVDMIADAVAKAGYHVSNGNAYIAAAPDTGAGTIVAMPLDSIVTAFLTGSPDAVAAIMQFRQNRILQTELKKKDATRESATAAALAAMASYKPARETDNDCIETEALRRTAEFARTVVKIGGVAPDLDAAKEYVKAKLADKASTADRWRTKHGENRAAILSDLTYQPNRKGKKATSAAAEETWGE